MTTTGNAQVQVEGSAPYPWPWDRGLEPARTSLVVVAAQPWFAARVDGAGLTLARLDVLAERLRAAGGSVLHLRLGGWGRRPALPRPGTPDWELLEEPPVGDLVVDAAGFDGFHGGPLDSVLRAQRVDHLLMGGLGLEAPVHSTLRGANDRGYECLLLSDATAAADPALVASALDSILMSGGIFGAVGTSTAVADALDRRVAAPTNAHEHQELPVT